MITSSAHATATAVGIRDLVRQLAREHGAQRLHLFLAVPHGLALLLGHLWDRMPPHTGVGGPRRWERLPAGLPIPN
jgi:hypothetical protein